MRYPFYNKNLVQTVYLHQSLEDYVFNRFPVPFAHGNVTSAIDDVCAFLEAHWSPGKTVNGIPADLLFACEEELARRKLTSLPLKLRFGVSRGMVTLVEVREWMGRTARQFETCVRLYSAPESASDPGNCRLSRDGWIVIVINGRERVRSRLLYVRGVLARRGFPGSAA